MKVEAVQWYLGRLARMGGREILHRIGEQARHAIDARRRFRWDDFGHFEGSLLGLPGLSRDAVSGLQPNIKDATDIAAGRIRLLNQDWPEPVPGWETAIWHIDPVSGLSWPGRGTPDSRVQYRHERQKGDVKFVWELNRLQVLQILAVAGDWDCVIRLLEAWMEANPPYDGINWTSGIEAASRIVSLLVVLALAPDEIRERIDGRARQFLDAHARRIARYPSLYSSANNHRVAELSALYLCSLCAKGLQGAPTWRQQCVPQLETLMGRLFFPDGVGAEQSPTYAAYTLEWFALSGVAARERGAALSARFEERAAAAAGFLRALLDDAGHTPQIGDNDETRVLAVCTAPEPHYCASILSLCARWLKKPEPSAPRTDTHLRDAICAGAITTSPAPPERTDSFRVFADGGYTIFHCATDSGTMLGIFDHGPLGFGPIAAHGHADALSFWLHWGEEPIFTDAGTFLYHSGGNWRNYFRQTKVHNTVTIDDEDQSTIAGPFNWSRHAGARLIAATKNATTAEHDGYRKRFGIVHRRTVSAVAPGEILITDQFPGAARASVRNLRGGFNLAPGIAAECDARKVLLRTPAGRSLMLQLESDSAVEWARESVLISPSFNMKQEAQRLFWHVRATGAPITTRVMLQ